MKIAQKLWSMMNDEGTLQSSDMLCFSRDPKLHTAMGVRQAFLSLTGKEWDAEFMQSKLE